MKVKERNTTGKPEALRKIVLELKSAAALHFAQLLTHPTKSSPESWHFPKQKLFASF